MYTLRRAYIKFDHETATGDARECLSPNTWRVRNKSGMKVLMVVCIERKMSSEISTLFLQVKQRSLSFGCLNLSLRGDRGCNELHPVWCFEFFSEYQIKYDRIVRFFIFR